MKKLIIFLLCGAFCLSLAGCRSEEDIAMEAANALLEAGDFDAAMEAYAALGDYEGAAEKLAEAGFLKQEAAMQAADALMERCDYKAAAEAYAALADFKDAADKLNLAQLALAMEEADALLEKGDYDAAIEAYSLLGDYEDAPAKLEQATYKKDEPYYGTWINMYDQTVFTFAAQGEGTADSKPISYSRDGNTLSITGINLAEHEFFQFMPVGADWTIPGETDPIPLTIVEENGICRMYCTAARIYLVPEASAEALTPVTVEITKENWEEYFYIYSYEVHSGPVGEFPGQCPEGIEESMVMLKEEYCDRVMSPWRKNSIKLDVTFLFHFNIHYYSYEFDSNGKAIFTPMPPHIDRPASASMKQTLVDYRMATLAMPSNSSRVYAPLHHQFVDGNVYSHGTDYRPVEIYGRISLIP